MKIGEHVMKKSNFFEQLSLFKAEYEDVKDVKKNRSKCVQNEKFSMAKSKINS